MATLPLLTPDDPTDQDARTEHQWRVRWANRSLFNPPGAAVAFAALAGLTAYLLVRQLIDPGYTQFLGYMVVQDTIAMVFLIGLGLWLAPESQISRLTYTLVVAEVWADSLGNAVHWYGGYTWYDKITHFGGGMAITAVAADLLFGLQRKRGWSWSYRKTIVIAAAIAMAFCTGWEAYELVGDRLIDSSRWKGWVDTWGDIAADSVGALIVLVAKITLDPNRLHADPFGRHVLRVGGRMPALSGIVAHQTAITRRRATGAHHVHAFVTRQHRRKRLLGFQGGLVRVALWFGVIAPIAALTFIGAAALTTPNYSDFADTISDLADQGQPHAMLVRIDMALFGLAMIVFGLGLSAILPRWRRSMRVLTVLFGASVVMTGIFRDYGEASWMPHNREGFIHNTFGVTAIVTIVIAMIATTSIGSRSIEWRPLMWPSIAGIFVISVSGLLFLWGPEALQGLVERLIYLAVGVWTLVAAHIALHHPAISTPRGSHRWRHGGGHAGLFA